MSENSNTQPPAAALDKIAPGGGEGLQAGLQKMMHQAETYMNRAVQTARPYAEAVQHSAEGLVQRGAHEGGAGGEGRGLLEQGLGRVQATFTQVTHAIDQRTATEKHPGLVTMLAQATTNMIEKVDRAMDASVDNPASTSAAAAAVAPFTAPDRRTSTSAPVVASSSNAPGTAPAAAAAPAPASAADAEPVVSGPNTASTSSAPVHEGEKPVTTTTNMVVHSDVA